MTFGVSAAPYLAIRTLKRLADDRNAQFLCASRAVQENFYVNDFFYGADSLDEVSRMRNEVIELLRRGGFYIRKWASNHRHALDNLYQKYLDFSDSRKVSGLRKALEISWDALLDEFTYSVQPIDNTKKITKRAIVSTIARIFDPLGLLGPVTLALKIIVQECWKLKVRWNQTFPQTLHTKWQSTANQLQLIKNLRIPRHVVLPDYTEIQIHGFCDSSQLRYAACLYLRSEGVESQVLIRLVCAKSRVAPVKQLTIPRLELCGAVLLTRLLSEVRLAINLPIRRVRCWTDSEIVLLWLRKTPQALQVFEGNRVAEIQRTSTVDEWRHIPGKLNPADALSCGQSPAEFLRNQSWFGVFDWLQQPENAWPTATKLHVTELPGLRKNLNHSNIKSN